ncbi:endonuclease domain-containing protein [Microbacterium sp. NPDC077663]|uniref:endonuclease domain-containing protein n=1 Tax=Microbacterium sp. NPDC077663 TaxID=3364189 RepID=UPI0037C73224
MCIVDIARPDAESGIESLLRLRLSRLGIRLESQVLVAGVGRVDFVLAGRLILEVDGRLNHEGPSRRHRDLVRDAEAAAAGYETLRFDYALVVHDWPRVQRAILAAVARIR